MNLNNEKLDNEKLSNENDTPKTFGRIEDWNIVNRGKLCINGFLFGGHDFLEGEDITTSYIADIAIDLSWVKTKNSYYALGKKAEWFKEDLMKEVFLQIDKIKISLKQSEDELERIEKKRLDDEEFIKNKPLAGEERDVLAKAKNLKSMKAKK